MRFFGGPPPSTMNKEWQEATNEYLKVGNGRSPTLSYPSSLLPASSLTIIDSNPFSSTEPKVGPVDGPHLRRLLGQGPRAVPVEQRIKWIRHFPLSLDMIARWNRRLVLGTRAGEWRNGRAAGLTEHGGFGGLILDGVNIVLHNECDVFFLMLLMLCLRIVLTVPNINFATLQKSTPKDSKYNTLVYIKPVAL